MGTRGYRGDAEHIFFTLKTYTRTENGGRTDGRQDGRRTVRRGSQNCYLDRKFEQFPEPQYHNFDLNPISLKIIEIFFITVNLTTLYNKVL